MSVAASTQASGSATERVFACNVEELALCPHRGRHIEPQLSEIASVIRAGTRRASAASAVKTKLPLSI